MSLPRHESANLGPSALCDEEPDNRVGHCTPGFTDEQHHGGLEGCDLHSGDRLDLNICVPIYPHRDTLFLLSLTLFTHYLSDIEQVDLQEERGGAGSHLFGRAADGKTQLAA